MGKFTIIEDPKSFILCSDEKKEIITKASDFSILLGASVSTITGAYQEWTKSSIRKR